MLENLAVRRKREKKEERGLISCFRTERGKKREREAVDSAARNEEDRRPN